MLGSSLGHVRLVEIAAPSGRIHFLSSVSTCHIGHPTLRREPYMSKVRPASDRRTPVFGMGQLTRGTASLDFLGDLYALSCQVGIATEEIIIALITDVMLH